MCTIKCYATKKFYSYHIGDDYNTPAGPIIRAASVLGPVHLWI